MKLDRPTRHQRILSALDETSALRVSELAERLDVSGETIRRDLDALDAQGLVGRTYGGAVRIRALEPAVMERHAMMVAERERIARHAVPHLAGASLLMIGSGATTVQVARRIAADMTGLTVVAHSVGVAVVLSQNPTLRIVMAPGVYHPGEGAMHGAATLEFLDRFSADWVVLGASGLDAAGVSDALLDAGEVYAKMMARAARTMVVADASKYARRFPAAWAAWRDVDLLVSDRPPPPAIAQEAADGDCAVVVA